MKEEKQDKSLKKKEERQMKVYNIWKQNDYQRSYKKDKK